MALKHSRKMGMARWLILVLATGLVCGCTLPAKKRDAVEFQKTGDQPARTPIYKHGGWIIARGTMHNHTIYSDGCRAPEDLLALAQAEGMAVLAFNDHRENKMCLGNPGLICLQNGGIEKVGYEAYFDRLQKVREAALGQSVIVLKGIEAAPFLYNEGKFPNVVIRESYNHFTVYALDDPAVLAAMPTRNFMTIKPETDPGEAPFQEFVDYITGQGGMVFAAHVEDWGDDWVGPVHSVTPAPIRNLMLKDLTGFAVLPDAWGEKTGGPGGLWDVALAKYMMGMASKPLWADGDADYHGPKGSLATATTLFYMKEFTEEEVYRCMREGRMVALQGEEFQDSYVSEWWVSDSEPPDNPVMLGREVYLQGPPIVRFALDHPVAGSRVRLIRNGAVVLEQPGVEFTFVDEQAGTGREPCFYRVEVIGPHKPGGRDYDLPTMPETELFVNPIFAHFSTAGEEKSPARQ